MLMSHLNTWNVGLVFHLLWCSVKISYVFHPCLPFSFLISCPWNTPFHRSNETPYWSSRTGDRWSWAKFLSWLNLVFCEQSLADRWLWPEFALNILWVCDVQITLAISYCLKKTGRCMSLLRDLSALSWHIFTTMLLRTVRAWERRLQ